MRKMVLALTVMVVPGVASAQSFTVPAIISPAQAQTPAPQPAAPPASFGNPASPRPDVSAPTVGASASAAASASVGAPASTAPSVNLGLPGEPATSSALVSTPNGGVMTALPSHPPPPLALLSPNGPLTARERQATTIAHRWRGRTASPSEGANGSVRFMFGATVPSVVCSPLYVCTITLQPGEVVNDIKAGDAVRWLITPSMVGSGSNQQTVVSVKPTDAGLRTNLIIATTRRLYEINLVSNSSSYTGNVTFTYPEDAQAAWQQYQADAGRRYADTTLASGQNLASLDFNYALSGDRPAWRPLRVYSDGIKTYIQFPRTMLSGDAPALVALGTDGSWFSSPTKQIVNYRVQGDTYVVDRVLNRAELVSGVGGSQDAVEITHSGGRG